MVPYCMLLFLISTVLYYIHTVLHCSTLYCNVMYCNALYSNIFFACSALYLTVLYMYLTVQHCIVLNCTALYCTVHKSTVLYRNVLCCIVMYSILQYITDFSTVQYITEPLSTLQHYAVLYIYYCPYFSTLLYFTAFYNTESHVNNKIYECSVMLTFAMGFAFLPIPYNTLNCLNIQID